MSPKKKMGEKDEEEDEKKCAILEQQNLVLR